MLPKLTAVDSRDAKVISKLPFKPSNAGTKMKTSVMFRNTSQCYSTIINIVTYCYLWELYCPSEVVILLNFSYRLIVSCFNKVLGLFIFRTNGGQRLIILYHWFSFQNANEMKQSTSCYSCVGFILTPWSPKPLGFDNWDLNGAI